MKYEIIKGSEKDFDGAPEWCTHVSKSTSSGDLAWEMSSVTKDGNKYSWVDEFSGYGVYENASGMKLNIIAERRPITEPVVWLNLDECDGSEYLVPVIGKEMECHAKDGSIFEVVVVAFDGDLPIVKTRLHGNYFSCDPSQLKPIRSPENVARDEAIASICFEIGVRPGNIVVQQTYDAIATGKIQGVKLEVQSGD